MKLRLLAFVLILLPAMIFAQGGKGQDIGFDCVVCHASFHNDPTGTNSLLPRVQTPIQIQGDPAHIAREEMCFTCHDGTILDSREFFGSENHKADMKPVHARVQDLPLDHKGEVYCGTCHTPHSVAPDRRGGFAPFLRSEVTDSELCLQCHDSQGEQHRNHPIHVSLMPGFEHGTLALEGNKVECLTCHPMHGDRPTYLVDGDDRSDLCSACHQDQFQIELTDHDLRPAENASSDACSACHLSHGGSGDFMWAAELDAPERLDTYCLSCHSDGGAADKKAFSHKGHPYQGIRLSTAVPELGIKAGEELACISCHDPHQWEFGQKHTVNQANEEGTEYTSFLKLPDDAQGQLCIACHPDQKGMFASDHSVVREGFQQYFREAGAIRGQCTVCHNSHEDGYMAGNESADPVTGLCMDCHNDDKYPTSAIHNNHPMGISFESRSGLSGHESGASTLLACNTCHDPHHWGERTESSLITDLQGGDRNSFLKMDNWPQPDLCLDCHPEKESLLTTDHDLSDIDRSACSFCHAPHNAETEYGILARWGETEGESFNEKHCFSCHQDDAMAAHKQVAAYDHPREYGTLSMEARGLGSWLNFPLFTEEGPSDLVGHIDCFTCHDPHTWSHRDDLAKPRSENDEGNDLTSFLRNPSHLTLCTDCHGPNTLWKYNYYHDPNKRKRY